MLIASKNVMFLEGIGAILRQDPSIEIVGEAHTLQDAIGKTDYLLPHVVLLDAVLTDGSTLEAIERLRKSHEEIGILVLNVSERVKSTTQLLKAGASAYLAPETGMEQLMELIRNTRPAGSSRRRQSSHNIQSRSKRAVRKPRKPDAGTSGVSEAEMVGAKEGRRA